MRTRRIVTIVRTLKTEEERAVIPTTFVPLAPERISFGKEIDVLFGLFHIMWADMPRPKTYRIKLSEQVTGDGRYAGCFLECGTRFVKC